MSELILKDFGVAVPEEHVESANRYFADIFSRLPHNTQRSYKSDLKSFYQYCFVNGMPGIGPDVKSNEECIKSYAVSMCSSQLAYNTIIHRMATLSKFMKIANFPDPLKSSEYLRDFIKLEMQEHDIYNRANQAPALRLEDLQTINDTVIPDTLLDIRDLAIINLMFDGLLRADELSSVQLKHIDHAGNKLLVPKSKSDQSGKGSFRYVSNTTLSYISDYIYEANYDQKKQVEKSRDDDTRINKGILFRPLSPKGTSTLSFNETITKVKDMPKLDYSTVYRALKRITKKGGIDIEVTGHSLRVGAAVTMAEAKVSQNKIQKAGAWKTAEMPARYTEQANVDSGMSELSSLFER